MQYEKGALIATGKTKDIYAVENDTDLVIVANKDDITAFDDPSFTKKFATKGEHATNTTCRVFELLQQAGTPVAYRDQVGPTEFVADRCTMVALEVVARRLAVGSYLKRHPELKTAAGDQPHRFHQLVVEFFLKTTGGELRDTQGNVLIEGLQETVAGSPKTLDDPFIADPEAEQWHLFHPKKPGWEDGADLAQTIARDQVVPGDPKASMADMEQIMRQVFLVLEGAWNTIGLRIIDMKIEFGITPAGRLLVADVIDNDSWRLRTHDWQELSKQAFRDGESLTEVEKKYGTVANLVQGFRLPNQALVFWRGSAADPWPVDDDDLDAAIGTVEKITLSGHKSPRRCLAELERLLAAYPDGGVIIAKVGRSNGLGPLLAARTSWPVIAIPATADKFPQDLWSSIRMPSNVPLATAWPEKNAVALALNILAHKNPALYMRAQLAVEAMDGPA